MVLEVDVLKLSAKAQSTLICGMYSGSLVHCIMHN